VGWELNTLFWRIEVGEVQWILEINLIRCSVGAEGADPRLDLAPTTPTNGIQGTAHAQAGNARTKVQKKARSLSNLRPEAKSADEFYLIKCYEYVRIFRF
jgi:hypothetical protein